MANLGFYENYARKIKEGCGLEVSISVDIKLTEIESEVVRLTGVIVGKFYHRVELVIAHAGIQWTDEGYTKGLRERGVKF